MLDEVIERTWAHAIIYLAVSCAIWYARYHIQWYMTWALLALSTFVYFKLLISAIQCERKIERIGKRSPRIRAYAPFGLDILLQAIWYFMHFRNHEFWRKLFAQHGDRENPYTCEVIAAGQRVIFTADEENIKAILATQFQEYGKGPNFRREWKDFLGLSGFGLNVGCLALLMVFRYLHNRW